MPGVTSNTEITHNLVDDQNENKLDQQQDSPKNEASELQSPTEETYDDEPTYIDSPEDNRQYQQHFDEYPPDRWHEEQQYTEEAPRTPLPVTNVMGMKPLMITQEMFGSQESGKGKDGDGRSQKGRPTYPYRARKVDDKTIIARMGKLPPKHVYFGYIYSSQSQRPPGYYNNYMLPTRKQPSSRQHIQIVGAPVPAEKIHKMKDAPKKFMPLSAVKVRWGSGLRNTVYKPEDVYAYLSRFGPIDGVYALTVNSALVIFSDLEAARAAITCPHLGLPWDPLITTWVEPRMHNGGFYHKYANIENPPIRMRT